MTRGINRFKALVLVLEEINSQYIKVEALEDLKYWVDYEKELSQTSLEKESKKSGSICIKKTLEWSDTVNKSIARLPEDKKIPFEGVKEGIKAAHKAADIAIVSSANPDAVTEEWDKHGLMPDVDILLAQDSGSKAYCIGQMLNQGYLNDHVLMVGDAPGDYEAAAENHVLYYPILVGREKDSWDRFVTEALEKLLSGCYAGNYQESLIRVFNQNLL